MLFPGYGRVGYHVSMAATISQDDNGNRPLRDGEAGDGHAWPRMDRAEALALAAGQGHTAMVLHEIANGADPTSRSSMPHGPTLLILAASYGRTETVAALLPHCDANSIDAHGNTALMHCCGAVHTRSASAAEACARLLIPHSNPSIRDRQGRGALFSAAARGTAELCRIIASTHDHAERDLGGRTALAWACAFGNTEVAAWLASLGGMERADSASGQSAAQIARESNHPDLAALLDSLAERSEMQTDLFQAEAEDGSPARSVPAKRM